MLHNTLVKDDIIREVAHFCILTEGQERVGGRVGQGGDRQGWHASLPACTQPRKCTVTRAGSEIGCEVADLSEPWGDISWAQGWGRGITLTQEISADMLE